MDPRVSKDMDDKMTHGGWLGCWLSTEKFFEMDDREDGVKGIRNARIPGVVRPGWLAGGVFPGFVGCLISGGSGSES